MRGDDRGDIAAKSQERTRKGMIVHDVDVQSTQVLRERSRVDYVRQRLAYAIRLLFLIGPKEPGAGVRTPNADQSHLMPASKQSFDQQVAHGLDPAVALRGQREPGRGDNSYPKRGGVLNR
jgi:hypothetical protein